jgi:stage V sporulation protein R
MRFEICPADIIYTFGAYGMPTRFSHWSFGKAFHRMKTQYDYNFSRIYELVINSDPCYAFLLDGNSLIQNKLVVAHVFGHCDFFKNNMAFRKTSRKMMDSMTAAAERIMEYEFLYGKEQVEAFLDAALAIQEHVDPTAELGRFKEEKNLLEEKKAPGKKKKQAQRTPYDDLWSIDKLEKIEEKPVKKHPLRPEKDMLFFFMEHARGLEDWQRDILSVVRDEMLYFWPQIETKIMNEGWATYWHIRILRELDLTEKEIIEYAKLNASIIQRSPTHLNPYLIGCRIWEDIEKRWGRERMFEIREYDRDSSFIRNYLTEDLVEELDMYLFQKLDRQWEITEKEWEAVRDGIVANLVNGGFPVIEVEDGDYNKNGELYLKHRYEEVELDIKYLEKTLPHVFAIWQKPVHLESVLNNKPVLFSYDGQRNLRKLL